MRTQIGWPVRSLQTIVLLAISLTATALHAETLGRCGEGWLERIDGYLVLHVKGSPREMGYQHGVLLKEHVRKNLNTILRVKADETLASLGPFKIKPRQIIDTISKVQTKHVPEKYFAEMEGLAEGAEMPLADVQLGNFLPELFHCSGFAVMGEATQDGKLYHGRVLDYATDWGLQDHAVLIVAEPDVGHPWVNVTYAGFIGCVTGMNARGISIGEMGGGGLGHWDGVPMALLVREALATSDNLESAIDVFRNAKRTCQYFYVIADGNEKHAVGMEASWNKFTVIRPGATDPRLPTPVDDCVLLSSGGRYRELVTRAKSGHGQFTAESSLRLMDRPVAMRSNLHNVLFEPASTTFWVANATPDGRPAAEAKYHQFQLTELLARRPE